MSSEQKNNELSLEEQLKAAEAKIAELQSHHAQSKRNRRGQAIGKDSEPGKFKPGEAAARPDFDPTEFVEKLEIYWIDGDGDRYLVKNETDRRTERDSLMVVTGSIP